MSYKVESVSSMVRGNEGGVCDKHGAIVVTWPTLPSMTKNVRCEEYGYCMFFCLNPSHNYYYVHGESVKVLRAGDVHGSHPRAPISLARASLNSSRSSPPSIVPTSAKPASFFCFQLQGIKEEDSYGNAVDADLCAEPSTCSSLAQSRLKDPPPPSLPVHSKLAKGHYLPPARCTCTFRPRA